ncbi:MAG: hypothetical protein ACOC2U_00030 [bacterium]
MTKEEQELFELKEEIEDSKSLISEKKGELKAIKKQLEEFNFTSIKQAQKGVKELEEQLSQLDVDIEEGLNKLKEKYEL